MRKGGKGGGEVPAPLATLDDELVRHLQPQHLTPANHSSAHGPFQRARSTGGANWQRCKLAGLRDLRGGTGAWHRAGPPPGRRIAGSHPAGTPMPLPPADPGTQPPAASRSRPCSTTTKQPGQANRAACSFGLGALTPPRPTVFAPCKPWPPCPALSPPSRRTAGSTPG